MLGDHERLPGTQNTKLNTDAIGLRPANGGVHGQPLIAGKGDVQLDRCADGKPGLDVEQRAARAHVTHVYSGLLATYLDGSGEIYAFANMPSSLGTHSSSPQPRTRVSLAAVAARTKARGWKKHLDGWQAGAVLLVLAGSAILLGLPRAAHPQAPPAPLVDAASVSSTMAADDERARRAVNQLLDVDVRAVGREVRLYNAAAASKDEYAVQEARERLLPTARKALRRGSEELLQLRAYQMLEFMRELRQWQATGVETEAMKALGGDFVATLRNNRWCLEGTRKLALDDRELRTLYKKRWNDITALQQPAFALTRDEDLVRFGFLLQHPFQSRRAVVSAETRRTLRRRGKSRLQVIDKLMKLDASYPADLARGVVHYQMGQFAKAGEQFQRHLSRYPDGPYTLRARNYLKAALDHTVQAQL